MRITSIVTAIGATLLAAAVSAPQAQAQALQATLVSGGFSQPIFVCSPPGDTTRLFVVEQSGRIKIIKNGATLPTPFLHVGSAASGGLGLISTGSERGLLGLAFHPNYATNGFFYVNYTASGSGATTIRRYTVSSNPDVANTASGLTMLGPITQPESNHNGGCIQFGPDGKLYIGMGDGGGANDAHGANGNGQLLTTLLGKILRIDVDLPAPYIPSDNPYFGSTSALQEIWHFGVRNPWRFSFDRATGDMYIGDVGQNAVEEIDFQPAGVSNLNYGWRCMEGNNCTGLSGCTCNSVALTLPIQTYSHSQGCSITGGYVYRGCAIPGLQGTYFYADYCTSSIWSFDYTGGSVTNFTNRTTELEPAGAPTISAVTSFGEDANGELYICDYTDGEIYRIDPAGGSSDCNANGVADGCDISTGFSQDVNTNGVPDECECFGGSPPVVYCTAKINSQFCLPSIGFTGQPKISAVTPFVISATNIINNKSGLLFYGYLSNNIPFQGGFMCVKSPFRRTGVQNSGGSAAGTDCTGVLSVDFTAIMQSGIDPLLANVGQQINAQFWSRDPQDAFTTNLTNALQFQLCQ